ncbi:MAG: potassium-transporting ATPase subunit KdpC [Proteobacteria bacterium]|nr:potassium-transporting ATPase subunit KdpC [Pseudomonadota bacterium]
MKSTIKQLYPSIVFLIFFSLLLGVIYPAIVMFVNQLAFPIQANGSLIVKQTIMGSQLIGQPFSHPKYFWSRPSATLTPYDASHSRGSNLSPGNPQLINLLKERIHTFQIIDPQNSQPIPIDLITASGSGLDPHISLQAAFYQAHRIANARQIDKEIVNEAILKVMENRQFGLFGEKRVNVVKLNLLLDKGNNS